ncbi:MAG: hypothetical protein CL874_06065 [Dehalococcoidales bacterium]|nr:hypothetical protein [Dehalococcoidales bacterium]
MKRLTSCLHVIDKISEWSGKIAGFGILLLILIVTFEVVSRYVFRQPTIWVHETSAFLFGGIFLIGGAYALLLKTHVNMDVFYQRFSIRTRATLDVATSLLFFLFLGVLIWVGGSSAWNSILKQELSNSHWAPPIYPIKSAIPLGALLLILQGLAKFVRDLITAFRPDATI